MSLIPAQFSSASLERFSAIYAQVSATYPECVVVDYAPYAFDTFTCRFRDGVRGVIEYGQSPHLIPLIQPWHHDFTVARSRSNPAYVVIGSKEKVREHNRKQRPSSTVIDCVPSIPDSVDSPSIKVLSALLTLLNFYILPDVTITNVNLDTLNQLIPTHCPDRPVEVIQNGTSIIIL